MTPEVQSLLARLDAATCDAERSALIVGASLAVVDALRATLTYRAFMLQTDADIAAEAKAQLAFTCSLQDARDDAARMSIIQATDPAFVAEWLRTQRATTDSERRRYLGMIGVA